MSDSNSTKTVSAGPLTLLFILFLGLKLGKVISWSWWWVFAPIWGPIALVVVLIFIIAVIRGK